MDNTTDTLQIKIERARLILPKISLDSINTISWKSIILSMNKKYNPDQLDVLETETELLLCGLLNPKDYLVELESRMKIPGDEANLLVGELDKLIFKKIQEVLVKKLEESNSDIFDRRFSTLPQNIQEAIAKSNWQNKLYEIGKKNNLSIDKMALLESITVQVISGKILPETYEKELSSALPELSHDILKEIMSEVNEKIMLVIRNFEQKQTKSIINDVDNVDDEVPIPPYAMPIYSNEVKRSESDIYKDSGIEITKNEEPGIQKIEKIEISNKEDNILNKSGINIIKGLRHPDNIISNKLGGITSNINTTTDYSIPKINKEPAPTVQAPVAPKIRDPYHEAIE